MKLLKVKTKRNNWLCKIPIPHWSKGIYYTVVLSEQEYKALMKAMEEKE